ncbi:MAG: proteasome assembly chaperone family protein [Candidatus Woesearchaeota archaeon]|nr:MAG: proteasome assembly chaperone family protein [Candidatus Woesearchaeota archaeon]
MELKLLKKPKGVTIVTGFPSIGLVGTIVNKFLLDKLDTELIGYLESEELIPVVAIHKGKALQPLGIHYNKKYNLVIFQALSGIVGLEWKIADRVTQLAKELQAKEIINIESMASQNQSHKTFFHTTSSSRTKDFKKLKIEELKEGIVLGVSGALLLKPSSTAVTSLFIETHLNLPDSEAAAEIIKTLDTLLKMNLDYKPLLETAKKFEAQLKALMEKQAQSSTNKEKRELSYLG